MTKPDSKALADAAIVLLREMFGEGVDFSYTTYFKSNEELSGIARAAQMPQWFASMICWTTFPQKM